MEVFHGLPQNLSPWHNRVPALRGEPRFHRCRVRFGSLTNLRQHLDTRRKGNRKVLEENEARGAGSKDGGGGGREEFEDNHGRRHTIHEQWLGSSSAALLTDGV